MSRTLLTIIADPQGALVIRTSGSRHTQHHAPNTQRASLLKAVQRTLPAPRSLAGIILAMPELHFSRTRSIIAAANALAFAAHCPVVQVPAQDLHDTSRVIATGVALLRDHPQRWLTPVYAAAPNISQPRRGGRFHENAGGIVFDPTRKALLFVERKDNGVVGTPKGHREARERLVDAAKREITEETGLTDFQLLATLPSVRYLSDDHGKLPKKIPHHLHHFLFLRTSRKTLPRVKTGEVANLRLLWWPIGSTVPPKKLHRDLRPVLRQAMLILRARKLLPGLAARPAALRHRTRP